jgi:hypothetical protein
MAIRQASMESVFIVVEIAIAPACTCGVHLELDFPSWVATCAIDLDRYNHAPDSRGYRPALIFHQSIGLLRW